MSKRLAMNTEGQLTYCTASEENIGKGRCNHIAHQRPDESPDEFCERANKVLKERNENKTEIKVKKVERKLEYFDGSPEDYEVRIKKGILSESDIAALKEKGIEVKSKSSFGGADKDSVYLECNHNDRDVFSSEIESIANKYGSWKVKHRDEDYCLYKSEKFELCGFGLSGLSFNDVSAAREDVVAELERMKEEQDYYWCDNPVPDAAKRGKEWDKIVDKTIEAAKNGEFDSFDIDETQIKIDNFVCDECEKVYENYESDININQEHWRT